MSAVNRRELQTIFEYWFENLSFVFSWTPVWTSSTKTWVNPVSTMIFISVVYPLMISLTIMFCYVDGLAVYLKLGIPTSRYQTSEKQLLICLWVIFGILNNFLFVTTSLSMFSNILGYAALAQSLEQLAHIAKIYLVKHISPVGFWINASLHFDMQNSSTANERANCQVWCDFDVGLLLDSL